MAVVPITVNATVYPSDKSIKPFKAAIVGYTWMPGLVGGHPPPNMPPEEPRSLEIWSGTIDPYPEYVLPLPPVDDPPPAEPPTPPNEMKLPPAEGGWGWFPKLGWAYFPGQNPDKRGS